MALASGGGTADDRLDAGRLLALPVRTDEQVEAGLRLVGLAELGELVGARVVERVHPETVAEVGHLHDHRLLVQREEAEAVHHVLVGTGDEGLAGIDVVGEHADLAARRHRQHAIEPPGLRGLGDRRAAVQHVDHRPAPDVRESADGLGVFRVHDDAGGRRSHVGRGLGQGNLTVHVHLLEEALDFTAAPDRRASSPRHPRRACPLHPRGPA